MISYEPKINTIRWTLIAVTIIVYLFALSDLSILPSSLHAEYATSRFYTQIPALLLLLLFTLFSSFKKYQHFSYFIVLTILTMSNIWFIKQSWVIQSFSFPYEGVLIYSVFAFFVIRLDYKLAALHVFLSFVAFAALLISYPIYAEFNLTYFGFFCTVNLICLVGLLTTTNSFKRAEKLTNKLEKLSQTDQLSGLLNRRAYESQANKYLATHTKKESVSVFLIDIDNFKQFNDLYGHPEGDIIIKAQADIIKTIFKRGSDIIGRFGGEEFIVIAPNTFIEEAEKMAVKINDLWKEYNQEHEQYNDLSCSVGLVSVKQFSSSCNLQSLILQADKALYKAKSSGKNCYVSTDHL